jgi:4-amino-4-deoxy-L-arabinose transferase-like glycosyltransferase
VRKKILFITIVFAFIIRFWQLGQNPPSLNWDEIAIGYNAYSLIQTGKDEFGQSWPSTFRSFDDYKSPAYIYATVPSILIFGKTEFAVRFPSALFGSLTVLVFYFFTKTILQKKSEIKEKDILWNNRISNIALLSTIVLAITPWHFHFSRVGFESNFALFWEILGAWLFLVYLKQKNHVKYLLLSVLAFSIALYSYANARLFIALLLLGYGIFYYKQIKVNLKAFAMAGVFGLILSSFLIIQIFEGTGLARFEATSIASRPEIYLQNDQSAKQDFDAGLGRFSSLMHNFRIPLFQNILSNYFVHYSYGFLFLKADLPRHQIPGFGLLYSWQLPLIFLGAVFLIKNRENLQAFPVLFWLFIAPIAAALTWQVPHAIRSELMLPIFSLLTGVGLWSFFKWLQCQDLKSYTLSTSNVFEKYRKSLQWIFPKASFLALMTIISVSLITMLISYSVNLPKEFSKQWLYGRKEMVEYVLQEKHNYKKVIVSLEIDWAYLWFLWYGPYTPSEYLSQGGTVSGGFEETQNKLDNIEFHPFSFDSSNFQSSFTETGTIYVGTPEQFPGSLVPNKTIYDLSGKPIIYIVKT